MMYEPDNLDRHIDRVEREREELRDERDSLKLENARLRTLCADLFVDVSHATHCPRYWEYRDRMNDLGIGVN